MIADTARVDRGAVQTGAFARLADRWIYVWLAGLFIATALVGFLPTSMRLLAAVEAGQRLPPPLILHVHAVLMGSWLLLFLAQATLMATGRSTRHKRLGLLAVVLAPAVVVAMIGVVKSSWSLYASLPPDLWTPGESRRINFMSNVLLEQVRMAILFAVFVGWAFLCRRRDPETHKRMMVLATVIPLPAAIDRIAWLPGTMAQGAAFMPLYTLLWLLPVLIYDIARRGRVHRAYVIGIALNLPFVIASYILWGSPWWFEVAPRLMGVHAW
jgi:hypothetical protein